MYPSFGKGRLEGAGVLSERLRKAVAFAMEAGYQLNKDAFDFLIEVSQTKDPVRLVEEAVRRARGLPERPLLIGRGLLEETAERFLPVRGEAKPPLPPPIKEARKIFRAYAKDMEADVRVVEDPTNELCGTGSVEQYLEYFRDRFTRIEKILRRRVDARDAMPISKALKSPVKARVRVIGMIAEKRESGERVLLRIEDLEADARVLVSSRSGPQVLNRARRLLLDQVVCVSAIKGRNNLLIAEDFIWPDVPDRKPKKTSTPVYAALISDLHVGSKTFMREAFSRFVEWLNGRLGSGNQRGIASRVKYVVIAGDLVDGIGVYPGQMQELEIVDIYDQYREVSKLIEQIPDYIEVLVIPGNHDTSRKALPQPAIPRDYAEPIYEARKVRSLGSPSVVRLQGVELLLYHGRSLDDVVGAVPDVSFQTPERAMRLLLQCRHLAPIYGKRTPIAPETRDFMVIERPPDIFHAGHVHVVGQEMYRGTLLVNSGAWQGQTEYQRKMGLTPAPGIAPVVNLQTLQVTPIDFTAQG